MYTLKIEIDNYPLNPRTEWDNATHMAFFHNRYTLGDSDVPFNSDDFDSWEKIKKHIKNHLDAVCLPVYIYDHGGVSISTTPFSCRWDSGQIGFVYMTRDEIRKAYGVKRITKAVLEKAYTLMQAEIDVYDAYLRGDVYGYIIEDEDGNEVSSCWGFYGYDYCQQAGQAELDQLNAKLKAA